MSADELDMTLEPQRFARMILPEVSRTFDLAIKFLPRRLGEPVGLAYLLCRIADTFEDSATLAPERRRHLLEQYRQLLSSTADFDRSRLAELKTAFAVDIDPAPGGSPDHAASVRLVENIDLIMKASESLAPQFRRRIFPRVQEMAMGMADYTVLADGNSNISFLNDESDWDRYCYYVAGTVGHMLTDIFADYAGFPDEIRDRLHPLGRSFGLGLQKVNILKDAVIDTQRGICFLPKTLIERYGISFDRQTGRRGDLAGLVRTVIEICRRHFQDSLEYIRMIPRKHLGLRMFLIVPVMLAGATLRLFSQYPHRLLEKGDVKLAKKEVWSLVRRSAYCKYSNRLLAYSFGKIYPA